MPRSRNVLTANLKVHYSHNFSVGEFIIKTTQKGEISHFIVDEVISNEKFKARALLRNGTMANNIILFEGIELTFLTSNFPANYIRSGR